MVRSDANIKKVGNKKLTSILARKSIHNSVSSTPKSARKLPSFRSPSATPVRPRQLNKSLSKSKDGSIIKRRHRPGTVALRQIRKLQKSTELLLPKLPFMRLVQEIMQNYSTEPYRLQSAALEALQEMTEMLLIDMFDEAQLCALHAKRQTVMIPDLRLTRRLKGRNDVLNP